MLFEVGSGELFLCAELLHDSKEPRRDEGEECPLIPCAAILAESSFFLEDGSGSSIMLFSANLRINLAEWFVICSFIRSNPRIVSKLFSDPLVAV